MKHTIACEKNRNLEKKIVLDACFVSGGCPASAPNTATRFDYDEMNRMTKMTKPIENGNEETRK